MRQYIGARYVPTFADPSEWTSGRPYEALTMVTYYNQVYISKQAVPPNTPITNTAYWILFADYPDVINDITARLTDVENNLAEVMQNPNREVLRGKRIIICGGSNDMDTTVGGVNRWAKLVREALTGIATVNSYAVAGSILSQILNQVEAHVADADIMFISASLNEVHTTHGTWIGGPHYTGADNTQSFWYNFQRLREIVNNNPAVTFIFKGLGVGGISTTLNAKYPLGLYRDVCAYGAAFAGCRFIDGTNFFGSVNPEAMEHLTTDGMHYKQPSQNIAANNAINYMANSYNNSGARYGETLRYLTYDGNTYDRLAGVVTLADGVVHYQYPTLSGIYCDRDSVYFDLRIDTDTAVTAGDVLATVDANFAKMIYSYNQQYYGEARKISGTWDDYGAYYSTDGTIRALNNIPNNTQLRVIIEVKTRFYIYAGELPIA